VKRIDDKARINNILLFIVA